jgi:hypothetical protein
VLGRGERLVDRERLDPVERGPLRQLAGEIVLPGLDLPLELVAPRSEAVDPGGDDELPAAAPVRLEMTDPAVVALVVHEDLAPTALTLRTSPDRRPEDLVPVAEDRRGDLDGLAERPLGRVAAFVDLRLHMPDLEAARWGLRPG